MIPVVYMDNLLSVGVQAQFASSVEVTHNMFENLVIGWPQVGWKMTRPAVSNVVQGMFGLRLDPIPTMVEGDRYKSRVFRDSSELNKDILEQFDALIVLGGHSADVLRNAEKLKEELEKIEEELNEMEKKNEN